MVRTYDCPIDGCGYDTFDVKDVAHHLESEHGADGANGDDAGEL